MRLLHLFAVFVCATSALFAESIGNFKTTGFTYGYEKWSQLKTRQTISKEGTTILGPADGGAGVYLQQALDLAPVEAIEISIKIAPGNTSDNVLLKIPDVQEWRIDLSKLSEDKFTKLRFPLSAESRAKPVEVRNVQVQGSFTPNRIVGITIESIELVVAK